MPKKKINKPVQHRFAMSVNKADLDELNRRAREAQTYPATIMRGLMKDYLYPDEPEKRRKWSDPTPQEATFERERDEDNKWFDHYVPKANSDQSP